jgi:hypothetical protein
MGLFAKKKQNPLKQLTKEVSTDILPSKDYYNVEQNNLKHMIEMRWRIIKFDNSEKEIVEISRKRPNKERLFLTHSGNWIKYDNSSDLDKYVIKTYYQYYVDDEEE